MSLPDRTLARIETKRLRLTVWTPADAPALAQAQEKTLEAITVRIEKLLAAAERGERVPYAAWDRETGALIGTAGLMARFGPGGLELGYWVQSAWRRKGIATEVSGALTRVAFEILRVPFMEIRCGKENAASIGVPRALGYTLEATLPGRVPMPDGSFDDSLVFALHAGDYPTSNAAKYEVAVYDDAGQRKL